MSTSQEFSAPDINAEDYYERLGTPSTASAGDINSHTKKYVAEFKPELSNHDNADERWKRFNTARQTLNTEDPKENYDTFRERFGTDQAAEAYETWQANDALGSPDTVSARDLGLESDVDESEQQSSTENEHREDRQSQRKQRQNRQSREERRRERARRRREGETNVDTDSSKTYSTRATDNSQNTTSGTESESTKKEENETTSSTFDRVVDHVRSTIDLAAMEVSTMLSMIELVVIGYVLYVLFAGFGFGSIPVSIIQSTGTVVVGSLILGLLAYEYLDRFDSRLSESRAKGVGTHFTRSTNPARLLLLPGGLAIIWGLVLLAGGGALTVLLLAVSVLSLYGRLRELRRVTDLPTWTDNVEPVGGVAAVVIYITLFVQGGQATGDTLTTASIVALVAVAVALLIIVGAPLAAAREQIAE